MESPGAKRRKMKRKESREGMVRGLGAMQGEGGGGEWGDGGVIGGR